jgi:type IV secretory pathway VirB2 component (pilin)
MDQAGETSAIVAAVEWLQRLLLGSVATGLATIAIAAVGFLFLAGRIELRRGAYVVLGCFIIFGAASIANGIMAAVRGSGDSRAVAEAQVAPPPLPRPPAAPPTRSGYDPYAGAAVMSK